MGKPVDSRVVEYAMDMRIVIYPNVMYTEVVDETQVTKYKHNFVITYEFKDEDGNKIGAEAREHSIEIGESMDDVAKKITKIVANLKPFIRADKLELSGYDIGE